MGKKYTVEKFFRNNPDSKKKQEAKRSLNHYINQLQLHFDLDDKDIVEVLEHVYKSNKSTIFSNKWWHFWE